MISDLMNKYSKTEKKIEIVIKKAEKTILKCFFSTQKCTYAKIYWF